MPQTTDPVVSPVIAGCVGFAILILGSLLALGGAVFVVAEVVKFVFNL